MPGLVFVGRTCIKYDQVARAGAFEKVSHPDRLRLRSDAEVLLHESLEIRQPSLGNTANRRTELEHRGIGQPVVHEQPILPTVDQSGLSQRLKMLRGIGEREPDLGGQRVHRALALREQLQHLNAVGTTHGLSDAGELGVQAVLELTVCIRHHLK